MNVWGAYGYVSYVTIMQTAYTYGPDSWVIVVSFVQSL